MRDFRGTAVLLVALGVGCASESPTSPTAAPSAPSGASTAVVTISSAGVSPQTVQIRAGERVLFTNSDSVVHEMSSDQHPAHLECPEINQVGNIALVRAGKPATS